MAVAVHGSCTKLCMAVTKLYIAKLYNGCTWLYNAVQGCAWLNIMTVYNCKILYMAVQSYTWLYKPEHGCTKAVHGCEKLYMGEHGCTRLYMAVHGCTRIYKDVQIHVQACT